MADNRWTITVVADDGEHATVEENKHGHLAQLIKKAVRALFGKDSNVDEYELVIAGTSQVDLTLTLEEAGLHDGAEVVVQPKDVSKG